MRHGWAIATCILLVSASAFGEPTQTESEADRLFQEGREAMRQRDFATACPKFAESQRLDPAPGTLLNLAECEEGLGHLADAWRHINETIRSLPPGDDRIPVARQRIASLEHRITRLTVRVSPGPGQPVLQIDGKAASLSEPAVLDPGSHRVVVTAPGYRPTTLSLTLNDGERREISVSLDPVTSPAHARPPTSSLRPTLGWIAMGVGAAGIATGVVTTLMQGSKQSVIDEHCNADKRCDDKGYDASEQGKSLKPWQLGGWIVGGVGLAAGSYLLLFAPSSNAPAAPRVGAITDSHGAVLTISGRIW